MSWTWRANKSSGTQELNLKLFIYQFIQNQIQKGLNFPLICILKINFLVLICIYSDTKITHASANLDSNTEMALGVRYILSRGM